MMLRLLAFLFVLLVAVSAVSYDVADSPAVFIIPTGDLQGNDGDDISNWSVDRVWSPKFLPRRPARREQKRIRPCFFSPIQCLMKRSYG
uniref:Uncharacterized protein n=1 Tax=Plectus sambesii TaxID=2011161 RepID=A0A914XLZ8_9BILA